MTSERSGNDDLLSIERVRAEKKYLDGLFDEFVIWHDNGRIKLRWVDGDVKF